MKKFLVILLVGASFGCTDAKFSRATNFNNPGEVSCYSGGEMVYSGVTSGKPMNLDGDGISFVEKGSGDLMELRMDCVVRYR